jgi:hypothetical protein
VPAANAVLAAARQTKKKIVLLIRDLQSEREQHWRASLLQHDQRCRRVLLDVENILAERA